MTPRGPYENARGKRAPRFWRLATLALLLAPALSCDDNQVEVSVADHASWTRVTDPAQVNEPYYPEWRDTTILFEYVAAQGPIWLGTINQDGTNRKLYTEPGPLSDIFPRWVTDDIVIYSSNKAGGGNYDIWYKVLSTNTDRRFTRFSEREFAPAPRPGRPSIAYTQGTEPLKGRIVVLADTAAAILERTYLTADTLLAGEPDWSPDGNQICFSAERADGQRHIWLAELADTVVTSLRELTSGAIYDLTPRFSPDGTRIVFTSNRSGKSGVWWVNTAGEAAGFGLISFEDATFTDTSQSPPVTRPVTVYSPSWSPDGQSILVSSDGRGPRAIWKISNLPF